MSIISQETWDNMPEEEKELTIELYSGLTNEPEDKRIIGVMNSIFGKNNLQPNKIRTWEDIDTTKLGAEYGTILELQDWNDVKLANKLIATYKIVKLIEFSYGGMITQEEWANNHIPKFYIDVDLAPDGLCTCDTNGDYHFIAFHTPEQREEFTSYPENVELVKQYYMI